MKSVLGTKLGMTQIFDEDGIVIPVTVIEVNPNVVTQIKTEEVDGYSAIQVGYGDIKEKNVNAPKKGHLKGSVLRKHLREFRTEDVENYEVGQEIDCTIFKEKEKVDVIGISKGKGTQGAIVRHNYSRGPESHGSKSHRVAGARSASAYPGRVFKGRAGSGKMGHDRVTVQNLEIIRVMADDNAILVKGAIPGPKGGLVTVREAVKKASK